MNYGKQKASKKQRDITSKQTMKKKRVGVRLFKGFLICLLVIAIVGIAGGGIFLKKIIDDSPKITPESVKPTKYTTFVYANDGATEIERFVSEGANRVYKSIDDIPKDLQNAFVAIEDERFYKHNGIDLQGILRAGITGITNGGNFSQGASTITQQLIKNTIFPTFTEEKTFFDSVERKVQEQYLAVKLEKQMDKKSILENYMNTINLGQNTLGVQSASMRYFGKDASELTLSESAVIAGITQNPGKYNPVTRPDKNAERREKVLKSMLKQGYIEQAAYDEAIADPVYDRIQAVNSTIAEETPSSYFVDALSDQVVQALQDECGFTAAQAQNALHSGGLSVFSTQDLSIQQICDEEANDDGNYPSRIEYGLSYALTITRADGSIENYDQAALKKYVRNTYGDKQGLVYSSPEQGDAMIEEWKATLAQDGDTYAEKKTYAPQPQTSVVVMDQYTGQVKAIVGGRGTKTESLSLNRATDSPRQPGSCFKILSTYAPAIDAAGYGIATSILDAPFDYDNGKAVKNWYGESYRGTVNMRKAIEQSMNICAVKMLTQITPQVGFEYLEKFGLTSIVKSEEINGGIYSDIQQATALGGITKGVYNLEMTAAYASLANNGTYNKPILFTKILDHDGNVLIDYTSSNPGSKQILKESTAGLLTIAMQDVITKGTGTKARLSNMPVSGKTGTTSDNIDIWFSAYTPYYTCSVWAGYDDNKELNNTTFHLTIWRNIMQRIHENLETKDFTIPSTVKKQSVCSITGMLPTSKCPTTTEYAATDGKTCTGHGATIINKGGYSNSENTKKDYESSDDQTTQPETPSVTPGDDTTNPGTGGTTDPGGGTTDPGGGTTDPGGGGSTDPGGGGSTDPGGGTTDPGGGTVP